MTLRNAFEGLSTAAKQDQIVQALSALLTELGQKFEAGQAVALDAGSLAALESINAAVSGAVSVTGTVGLDAPSLSALEQITAVVSGPVTLASGAQVTLADSHVTLDATSLAALESITVGGTVDLSAGSLAALEQITATLSGPVALDSATLAALEAITATISGTVTVTGTVELGSTSLAALEKTTTQVNGVDVSAANPMPVAPQGTAPVDVTDRAARAAGKVGIQVAGADAASNNPIPVAQQGTVDISNRDTRQLGWAQVLSDGQPVGMDNPMAVEFAAPQYVTLTNPAPSTVSVGNFPSSQTTDMQKSTPRIVTGGPVTVADGSTASDVCPATEVFGRWVTFQASGTFSATYSFQESNDNVTWKGVPLQRVDTVSTSTTSTTANIWHGPIAARYFRVRVTSYTSGSVSGVTVFSALPTAVLPAFLTSVTDALADQQVNDVSARNLLFNGSTWDRMRSGAQAAVTGRLSVVGGTAVSQVLSGATALGASTSVDLGAAHSKHAMQIVLTGSPTTATVALEVSLNGSQWTTAATWSTGAGQASGDIVYTADKPVRYVRANLTALSGGTSPTVSAYLTAVST